MAIESKKAVVAAIIANAAIAVIKFVAGSMTGSSAMISEGIHSLVDTGNGGLLYHGLRRGAQIRAHSLRVHHVRPPRTCQSSSRSR